MRQRVLSAAFAAAALLAACGQTATQQAEAPVAAEPATFEDTGCLGVLLHHKQTAAAPAEQAALDAAIAAWRASAEGILTADELAQYEASSVAIETNSPAPEKAQRVAPCIATAPH